MRNWLNSDPHPLAFRASGGSTGRIEDRPVRPLSGRFASWLAAGRILFPSLIIATAIGAARHSGSSITVLLLGAQLLLAIGLAYCLALRGELFWPTRGEFGALTAAGAACLALLMLSETAVLLAAMMPLAMIWLAPAWAPRLNSRQAAFAAICAAALYTSPIVVWNGAGFSLGALGLAAALAAAYGLTCRDAETHVAA
jgi:hypothetical protein